MIIVDNVSQNPVISVIIPFQNHLNLSLISQVNSGLATARNTGAKQAKGKFLAFINDDCTPKNDWLRVLESYLIVNPDDLICACIVNALYKNIYVTASQALLDYINASYHN